MLADEVSMWVPWCVDKKQEESVDLLLVVFLKSPKSSVLLRAWMMGTVLLLCSSFSKSFKIFGMLWDGSGCLH